MELTLSPAASLRSPVDPARGAPTPLTRDAVMSQLDLIAASGKNLPSQGLGAAAMLLAVLGGVLVVALASLLNGGDAPRSNKPALAQSQSRLSAKPAVVEQTVAAAEPKSAAPVAIAAATVLPAQADADTALALRLTIDAESERMSMLTAPAEVRANGAVAGVAEPADNKLPQIAAVIKAPPERAAEDPNRVRAARAAAAARARAAAVAQRQQDEQRDAALRAQEQQLAQEALERQQAADKAKAAQTRRLAALDVRRSVQQTCAAAGGLVSQQFCAARECRSADNQRDATCMRLREEDEAQRQASNLR